LEKSSIYKAVKKLISRSSITLLRVSSSTQMIFGSFYFSIVSTKVVMKYFVMLIAPYLLLFFIAETRLGKHLQA